MSMNLNENDVNYLYCLKLAKIFERETEFKMLKCLYFSLKGDIIDTDFFAKQVEEYKKSIVTTPNKTVQLIMGDLFMNLPSKQDAVNIISYLSIIEDAVNKEDYEVAKKAKDEIVNMKGMSETEYFKMYKFFVTDYPVKYDI